MVQGEHKVLYVAYIINKIALALSKLWVISVCYHLCNHTLSYMWVIYRDKKVFWDFWHVKHFIYSDIFMNVVVIYDLKEK